MPNERMSHQEIISQIRSLARTARRTPAQNAQFTSLCRQSKSMHEAERAAEARAAKRSAHTATPKAPADLQHVDAEIKRLGAKGDKRTLTEDRYLKQLRTQLVALNAAKRNAADGALVERARDKQRQVRANRIAADPTDIGVAHATRSELRDAGLATIEREQHRLAPAQLDQWDHLLRESDVDRDAAAIARRLLVTESDAYRSAFRRSVTEEKPSYSAAESWAINQARDVLGDESRAAGESGSFGLAVPATIDPTIILAAQAADAPVVQLARLVTITSDVYRAVTSPGVTWAVKSEAAVMPSDAAPTLAQPSIPVEAAVAWLPYSVELGQDYPQWAEEAAAVLGKGYVDLLANQSVVGTTPQGVMTAMVGTTTSPSHIVVTTSGSLGAVDCRAAWAALPQRFRPNATWLMAPTVETLVRKFAGANSEVDYLQTLTPDGTTVTALTGRPLVTSDYCAAYTGSTAGTYAYAVVGDFGQGFTFVQRAGMTVELVPVVRDTSGRPIFSSGWQAFARFGHDVVVPEAFRVIANA
jgi:HK97 family phage major capsid protein